MYESVHAIDIVFVAVFNARVLLILMQNREKKRKVYKKREEIAEKRGKQTVLDIKKASATTKIRRVFSALANTIEQRPLVRERAAVACDARSCAVRRRAAKKKGIAL